MNFDEEYEENMAFEESEEEDEDRDGGSKDKRKKDQSSTPPKRLKRPQSSSKTFQLKWLDEPLFKGWLKPDPNSKLNARCACCDMRLKSGKSELEKHARTEKHKKNEQQMQGQRTLESFNNKKHQEQKKHAENVKGAEIKLASFFVDHNIAFNTSDDLVAVQKQAFKDSTIAKDITLGRDKCAAIVRNVIGKVETDEIVKDLQENLFSIMVDESTDVGQDKNLCVVVDYIYPKTGMPRVCLLELVRLDARDCSAAKLWDATVLAFQRLNIPITNIVALACDSCPTMVGCNNSFWTRLKAECPWAVLIPCVCHSVAKVSEKACSMLPDFVQDHLRSTTTYLTGSPKRSRELIEFQEFYDEELKKIIKPAGTRWLVLHACVAQYLKIQKSLLAFFELRVFEDPKDRAAAKILMDLKNPYTVAYFHFLDYALDFTNKFNALFQSRKVMIHKLYEKSEALMINICQNFLKSDQLSFPRLGTMDFTHPANHLPLREVYLGPGCKAALDSVPQQPRKDPRVPPAELALQLERDKDVFRSKCLDFYVRAAKEMRDRLPLNQAIFKEMAFVDPEVLLSQSARIGSSGLADLTVLSAQFKDKLDIDETALAREWRQIQNEIRGMMRQKLLESSVEDAWVEIRAMKNGRDEPMFPQLSKLASVVLIMPHSNAESERVFSIVTDVRSKKRNRLGSEMLNAICVSRVSFRSKGISCASFEVNKAHLEKHNSDMYARGNK